MFLSCLCLFKMDSHSILLISKENHWCLTLSLSSLGLGKLSGDDNKFLMSAISVSIRLTSLSMASTSYKARDQFVITQQNHLQNEPWAADIKKYLLKTSNTADSQRQRAPAETEEQWSSLERWPLADRLRPAAPEELWHHKPVTCPSGRSWSPAEWFGSVPSHPAPSATQFFVDKYVDIQKRAIQVWSAAGREDSVGRTEHKDGQHESSHKMEPKHLECPLVVSCNIQ